MNHIRASWHLADMTGMPDDDSDPFENVVYSAGVTIDLTASEEELGAKLVELMLMEKSMFDAGLTCDLKWAGQDCRTCPQATLDPRQRRARLCRLGKDQCSVDSRYKELRDARLAPVEELAQEIDAASELGVLPDDVAELLTQVGPQWRGR